MDYYKDQLSRVNTKGEYKPRFKVCSDKENLNADTKWMELNDESANELVKWLKENYNIVDL